MQCDVVDFVLQKVLTLLILFFLQSKTSQRASPPKEFASLNVTAIEHCNNITSTTDFQSDFDQAPKPLKTLDLRLEEVAHIRSVLTKVELEAMPIDSAVRDSISRGKVRFTELQLQYFCGLKPA